MNYYGNLKNIFTAFSLSFGYVILGILSIKFITMTSGIAIAWLPNSLLLAFFLTKDIKEWKYYIPFFVAAEIIADYPAFSIIQALQFSFINLFETTLAAYLIRKISKTKQTNFLNVQYVMVFFFIGFSVMPALSAILGASVYYTQIGTDATFFEFWRVWYFGDAIGVLLLTPLMVILKENYRSLKNYDLNFPNIIITLLTLLLALQLFSFYDRDLTLPTTPFIFILILLWVVYKQGILPALLLSFFIVMITIYYTVQGLGPFAIFEVKETTIYLQEFIALLFIITLFFGVLHKEISDSKNKLKELNQNLEKKVEEKTQSLLNANEKLTQLAIKDSLTNIYNRRMLNEYILQETLKSKRYNYDLSLIMIDIDHFKEVNDKYGHHVGDAVLLKIVKLISGNIRKVDIFGRWGGEEFLILLPNTNLEKASKVAENIREKIATYVFDKIGSKTVSLGVVAFDFDEDETLFIKRADDALYEAKHTGRNKVVSKLQA
jgi:diguanylate cyclase (GGDEF)-like protein